MNVPANELFEPLDRRVLPSSSLDLAVSYQGTVIECGDSTPSVADGTDFGDIRDRAGAVHRFDVVNRSDRPIRLAYGWAQPVVSIEPYDLFGALQASVTGDDDWTLTLPRVLGPGQSGWFQISALVGNRLGDFTGQLVLDIPGTDDDVRFMVHARVIESPRPTGVVPRLGPPGFLNAFGTPVPVGHSARQQIFIDNQGTGRLLLTPNDAGAIRIEGPDAADFDLLRVDSVADSYRLLFRFRPSAPGLRTASVVIATNSAEVPEYRLTITGAGTALAIEVDGAPANRNRFDLGLLTTRVGEPVERRFSVRNTSDHEVTLGRPRPVERTRAAEVSFRGGTPRTLRPGEAAEFVLRYLATEEFSNIVVFRIRTKDDPSAPLRFDAYLAAGTPVLRAATEPLGQGSQIPDGSPPSGRSGTWFGPVPIGHTADSAMFLVNAGSGLVTLSGERFQIAGPGADSFRVYLEPGSRVWDSQKRLLRIEFGPTRRGEAWAVITFFTDNPAQPTYSFWVAGLGSPA